MLKSFYKTNKIALFLILCFLVIAAPGCKDDGITQSSDPAVTTPLPVTAAPPDTSYFKFGVMGDTQWAPGMYDPSGRNPEAVSASIITQMHDEFINHDVKFVVQAGDLTEIGHDESIAVRANLARDLFDAGIGFFGMRGNHESYLWVYVTFFGFDYPTDDNEQGIPAIQLNFPQQQGLGDNLFGATNFSSPTSETLPEMAAELNGISYAFDYDDGVGNSATFVIFDPWPTDLKNENLFSYYNYGYRPDDQQEWISGRLDSTTRGTEHAFVFSHQPLIAGNHYDSPFGKLDDDADIQNTFYAELVANDVAFYIGGHDHMHHRSIVTSPDGLSSIEQLIAAPACPKFYHVDYGSSNWGAGKSRQTVISAEFDNVGYYIYTVDGPMVTVDYYSDATGGFLGTMDWPDGDGSGNGSVITPEFNFVLTETWRYSMNGQDFMISQGGSYSSVTDTYSGTAISLAGTNTSTSVEDDFPEEGPVDALTKKITTAWKDQRAGVDSNILLLAGLKETGAATADKYVLTMSATGVTTDLRTRIVTLTDGEWELASRYYNPGEADITYKAGSWGYDGTSIWVVLDYDGAFAIRN